MAANKQTEPARDQTDTSLRIERQKTDDQLSETGDRLEVEADELIHHARERADQTLGVARAKAEAKLQTAGASPEVRASAKANQATEEALLANERDTADDQLMDERERRHRAVSTVLHLERGQTDKHLSLERSIRDDALIRILGELGQAVRFRDDFLALASHELRTPLTPLTLRLDMLRKEVKRQPDSPFAQRVNTYVEAATHHVNRLTLLVAELLDVSSLAADELNVDLHEVDFAAVVRSVIHRYESRAARAGCELDVDVKEVTGRWDKLRLDQAVSGVVENAIKFGAGKPIRVVLGSESGKARFTVEDQGIGIAPEYTTRIFDRFERGVSDRHYGGLGLGLYICATVVQAMGGTIAVQSEVHRGSKFTIELPLQGQA